MAEIPLDDESKKKILVVDDDANIIDHLSLMLGAKGFRVVTAKNGADGLRLVRDENPDLIILDVMMPIMNGYQVCALLKGDEHFKDIPIIMLTGRAQDIDRETGRDVGADVYILKPYNYEELLGEITSRIGGSSITAGDEEVNDRINKLRTRYGESLPRIIEEIKTNWTQIRIALVNQNQSPENVEKFTQFKRTLHNISGVAGNFGMAVLGDIARRIEVKLNAPLEAQDLNAEGTIKTLIDELEYSSKQPPEE